MMMMMMMIIIIIIIIIIMIMILIKGESGERNNSIARNTDKEALTFGSEHVSGLFVREPTRPDDNNKAVQYLSKPEVLGCECSFH